MVDKCLLGPDIGLDFTFATKCSQARHACAIRLRSEAILRDLGSDNKMRSRRRGALERD